jgi:hypothetical protein
MNNKSDVGNGKGRSKMIGEFASQFSVLAHLPVECANVRTSRGLVIITDNLAYANSVTNRISKPPVASVTAKAGFIFFDHLINSAIPVPLFLARQVISASCMAISNQAFDYIPTKILAVSAFLSPYARVSMKTTSYELSSVWAIIDASTAIIVVRRPLGPNDN